MGKNRKGKKNIYIHAYHKKKMVSGKRGKGSNKSWGEIKIEIEREREGKSAATEKILYVHKKKVGNKAKNGGR
jgi:hypothetical protein